MLSMNETIRSLRRAQGLTQEQLAMRLGVSAPAVSKWEQGASYPDVTLLPALARSLHTDLNTLMGFERMPERAQVHDMLSCVRDRAMAEGIDAGVSLAQDLAQEYPACGALLFGLAATLEGRMMMAGMTQAERAPYEEKLRGWYERAAHSEDEEAREAAAHMLASRALAQGRIGEAQRMMDILPREPSVARWTLEASLLRAKGETEQAEALVQRKVYAHAAEMQQMLLRLEQAALDADEPERAQALADLTQRFIVLLGLHPYTGHMAQLLPALKRQDAQACLVHIGAMLKALEAPWLPGSYPLYEKTDMKKSGYVRKDMLAGIVREMEESEEYAFLRNEEAFRALLAAYRM